MNQPLLLSECHRGNRGNPRSAIVLRRIDGNELTRAVWQGPGNLVQSIFELFVTLGKTADGLMVRASPGLAEKPGDDGLGGPSFVGISQQ